MTKSSVGTLSAWKNLFPDSKFQLQPNSPSQKPKTRSRKPSFIQDRCSMIVDDDGLNGLGPLRSTTQTSTARSSIRSCCSTATNVWMHSGGGQRISATSSVGAEAPTIQALLRQVTGRGLRLGVLVAAVLFERMVDLTCARIPAKQQDASVAETQSAFSLARREILEFIASRMKKASASDKTTHRFRFNLRVADASDDASAAETLIAYRRLRAHWD
jgi:hypothetical protein